MSISENKSEKDVCLEVKNLKVYLSTSKGMLRAVDDVSFNVFSEEILGIVGESGCGKTMTALSIMGLIPYPGRIYGGKILFHRQNLLELTEDQMRLIRGKKIGMVLQDPFSSLNPVYTIGNQLSEVLGKGLDRNDRKEKVVNALKQVSILNPEVRFYSYPFELSGGMNQRCVIAMTLLPNPELIIADEPTTSLDVTIQMQVLNLLKELQGKNHSSIIIITHDFGVVAAVCTSVLVMYSGKIVENGSKERILRNPCHPYTKALLASIPKLGDSKKKLHTIPGQPGEFFDSTQRCLFANRCDQALPICGEETPPLIEIEETHWVSCWRT